MRNMASKKAEPIEKICQSFADYCAFLLIEVSLIFIVYCVVSIGIHLLQSVFR